MKRTTTSPWVSLPEAQEILCASRKTVSRLASRGLIGTRQLPGCRASFSRADILALMESYTRPATAARKGSEQCQPMAS